VRGSVLRLLLAVRDDLLVGDRLLPRVELVLEPQPHLRAEDDSALLELHPVGGLVQFTVAFGLLDEDLEEVPEDLRRGHVRAQDGDRRVFMGARPQDLLVSAHLLPALLDLLHQGEFLRGVRGQLEGPDELGSRRIGVCGPSVHVGVMSEAVGGQLQGDVGNVVAAQCRSESRFPDTELRVELDAHEAGALGDEFALHAIRAFVGRVDRGLAVFRDAARYVCSGVVRPLALTCMAFARGRHNPSDAPCRLWRRGRSGRSRAAQCGREFNTW
jgi:hypothetical protein